MSATNTKYREGFTLLEIIVSITLLSLIALLIMRVFNESTKAVERSSDHVSLDETARVMLDMFEHDISQALIRNDVVLAIQHTDGNSALNFITPAVRKYNENILRDTSLMRISSRHAANTSVWNRFLEVETVEKSDTDALNETRNLIKHSDYYGQRITVENFGTDDKQTYAVQLSQALTEESGDHAALTFLDFVINADPKWAYTNLASTKNRPRFIDVTIGLISSSELRSAVVRDDAGYVEKKEQIYTRRIFIRNQGIGMLGY